MAWERNLRSAAKKPLKKSDMTSPPGAKKEALRRAMRKAGRGGRGGGGGGGAEDGSDGRPSIGTWAQTQQYLAILKEISGKVSLVISRGCSARLHALERKAVGMQIPAAQQVVLAVGGRVCVCTA